MVRLLVCHVSTFISVSVCRTLMPFRIVIRNLTVYLRYEYRPTHSELSEIMSHVYYFCTYMFFFIYWITLQAYVGNYQTITNTDVVTNDQPMCKNKGRNESNELSSSNLRFFRNNLGLVFHTPYYCIFHACYLLLLFPLLHFPPVRSTPVISTPAFSALAILTVSHFSLPHFQSPHADVVTWSLSRCCILCTL